MKSGIYSIKNLINGKLYIGSAVDLRNRFSSHISKLRSGLHYKRYLKQSIPATEVHDL